MDRAEVERALRLIGEGLGWAVEAEGAQMAWFAARNANPRVMDSPLRRALNEGTASLSRLWEEFERGGLSGGVQQLGSAEGAQLAEVVGTGSAE